LPRLKIVDVGAMSLGEGNDPYSMLLKAVPCEIIGFEPVSAELEKLNKLRKAEQIYLPYFIGDGSTRMFYECNFPMTSSLFEPNTALLAKFQNLENLTRVVKTYEVQTKRLDDIPEAVGTDFLKVDVQGGEMLVFRGAVDLLRKVVVIHTEVEFVQMYKNQPLFADIDDFLRSHGFLLHKLDRSGRTFKPLVMSNDVNAVLSQWLWGDAVYVRDFMKFDQLAPEQLLKVSTILHENYRSFDLAAVALEAYDRKTGSQLQPEYIKRIVAPSS
jgi:FkbM family methyltransferase